MHSIRAIEHLNSLMGAGLMPLLEGLSNSESVARELVSSVGQTYLAKTKFLNTPPVDEGVLQSRIDDMLLGAEGQVANMFNWQPFYTTSGLDTNTRHVHTYTSLEQVPGLFITRQAAERLLSVHPPNILEGQLKAIDPLTKLALTRHTEDTEWQQSYNKALSTLSANDFEERHVTYAIHDSEALRVILDLSGQRKKPWRISHNKEAGIVSCFTHPHHESLAAPLMQHVLVQFHYFFETQSAGQYIKAKAKSDPETVGLYISKMIHTHTDSFPFFHPNAYSEHLYWEKAIALFFNHFSFPETDFFADTIDCGAQNIENHTISLNIVDRVWDVNLGTNEDSARYFGKTIPRFTYHFQEALWYKALSLISGLSTAQAESLILENLHLGDRTLTPLLLSNHEQTTA